MWRTLLPHTSLLTNIKKPPVVVWTLTRAAQGPTCMRVHSRGAQEPRTAPEPSPVSRARRRKTLEQETKTACHDVQSGPPLAALLNGSWPRPLRAAKRLVGRPLRAPAKRLVGLGGKKVKLFHERVITSFSAVIVTVVLVL